ncbi:MAG: hypothetical protein KatS3mg057_1552 [Herpetosiphonaceae bacterium]|nr:MAG: hypothetical protein KatS3mg057_1552 [Herpetosiphonaceae bacterium]
MEKQREDRSLGELFGELSREMTTLVREEVELAKAEMSQKVSRIGMQIGYIAAGGALAYAGLLAIVAAAIVALALILPLWLSALLIGLLLAGVGYYLYQRGMSTLKQTELTPRKTIETLKEDKEWAKEQMK